MENQLLIQKSSIVEKRYNYDAKQYEITNLQLTINEYKFTSQFNVSTIYLNEVDIILGSPWMETLGSVILNMKKNILTFSYKKQITLQDVSMKSDSWDVSSEDFKDILKMISQEDQKSRQKTQKELEKFIMDKEEEISRLRDHNQKFLLQVNKVKY